MPNFTEFPVPYSEVEDLDPSSKAAVLSGLGGGASGIGAFQAETPAALRAAAEAEGRAADVQTHLGNLTIALTDLGTYTRVTSLTAGTITIPAQATVAWPAGARLTLHNEGPGDYTLTAENSDVAIEGPRTLVPGETCELTRLSEDRWKSVVDLALTDSNVASYVAASGLQTASSPARRLNGAVRELRALGLTIDAFYVGKSEFAPVSGTTFRAVVSSLAAGGNGTITGSVTPAADGLPFVGNAANYIDIPNPQPGLAVYLSMMAGFVPNIDTGTHTIVAGGPLGGGASSNFGPLLQAQGDTTGGLPSKLETRFWVSSNGTSLSSFSTGQAATNIGMVQNHGGQISTGAQCVAGIWGGHLRLTASNYTSPTLWNNNATWRIGATTNGQTPANGKVQYILIFREQLTTAQVATIPQILMKYRIADFTPRICAFVGDSMTLTESGGAIRGRTTQLMAYLNSGWRGSVLSQIAVGGQNVLVQEVYFEQALQYLKRSGCDRYVFFWPGFNGTAPGLTLNSQADAQALADRYLAMGARAADLGIQSIFWSRTRSNIETSADWINISNFFNDYLKAQCAAEGYIFYDHRVTYPTEFDGDTRDPAFTGDGLHFSQAGVEALCADFVSQFPTPINPFV